MQPSVHGQAYQSALPVAVANRNPKLADVAQPDERTKDCLVKHNINTLTGNLIPRIRKQSLLLGRMVRLPPSTDNRNKAVKE